MGDAALGEWREWSGFAFHIRRRLSAEENPRVGPVVDVRGTQEGKRRRASMTKFVPSHYGEF